MIVIGERRAFVWGVFVGMLVVGMISGIAIAVEEAHLSAATEKLAQYTMDCDDDAFLMTLSACFDVRKQSCGMSSGDSCSKEAMEQCHRISTTAHCTGRKE